MCNYNYVCLYSTTTKLINIRYIHIMYITSHIKVNIRKNYVLMS